MVDAAERLVLRVADPTAILVVDEHVHRVGDTDREQQRRQHRRDDVDGDAAEHHRADGPDERGRDGDERQDDAPHAPEQQREHDDQQHRHEADGLQRVGFRLAEELLVEDRPAGQVVLGADLALENLADRTDGFDLVLETLHVVRKARDDGGEAAVGRHHVADVEVVLQRALAERRQRRRIDRQLDQIADLERVALAGDRLDVGEAEHLLDVRSLLDRPGDAVDLGQHVGLEHVFRVEPGHHDLVAAEVLEHFLVLQERRVVVEEPSFERVIEVNAGELREGAGGHQDHDRQNGLAVGQAEPGPRVDESVKVEAHARGGQGVRRAKNRSCRPTR